ncbi:MAG TPA: CAP domain-containing protein [Pseudonocardia sp.]
MLPDLPPGANVALPGPALGIALGGPFDLSALVLSASGSVAGDADMVFFNQPDAPGVRLRAKRLTVTPERLRRGAERVMVVASPEEAGSAVGVLPPLLLSDAREQPFARFLPPPMPGETVALLAEVYQRAGAWRVRAVGQGYADGLAGLARDFGVDVAEEEDGVARGSVAGEPPPSAAGRPRNGSAPNTGALADVVVRTNAERARHGVPPLTVDARLAHAAQAHSADMVRRSFFAHENPDGRQVWDRAVAAGYLYRKVAENIAAGQRSAQEVVLGWMNSPGHRANILDGELTQIGVGCAEGGSYGFYWTQVFGTPR